MRLAVIVNVAAGKSQSRIVDRVRHRLPEADVRVVTDGMSIPAIVREVLPAVDAVVAVGGDGTINAVASALVDTDVALGVIPAGTFNHFARDLGVADVDRAFDVITAGEVKQIDVGEVNGRIFLNNSNAGLYPRFAAHRHRLRELGRRWMALVRAAITTLRRVSLLDLELDVGGARMHRRTALVFVGNNAYRAQWRGIGGRDRLDGGQLCLYVAHDSGRHGLLRLAARAFFFGLKHAFDDARATEITIATPDGEQPIRVSVDGEVTWLKTPLRYRIRPRALRVLVP